MADSNTEEDAFGLPPSTGRRYFFRVQDGEHITEDDEGLVYETFERALAQAVTTLPEIMHDAVPDGDHREVMVVMFDEDRKRVARARLVLTIERL